jgi:hypothetical protein
VTEPKPARAAENGAPTIVARVGFGIAAAAAALVVLAPGDPVVTGPRSTEVDFATGNRVTAALALIVLAGTALLPPRLWNRLAGVGIAALAASFYAAVVILARRDDVFPDDATLELGGGGTTLAVAFCVTLGGLLLGLLGRQRPAPGSPPPTERNPRAAVIALLLSPLGLLVGPVAPAIGAILALLVIDQLQAARARGPGRTLAVVGLALCMAVLCLSALRLGQSVFE